MNLFQKIAEKMKSKKFWAISTIASLVMVLGQLSPGLVNANAPKFNTTVNDQVDESNFVKIWDQKNEKWADYVDMTGAKEGDEVKVRVYYHNNTPDSLAYNTRVKVNLPDAYDKNIDITGLISADNATTVTDSAPIKLSDNFKLDYVASSTKHWKWNTQTIENLPDGIAGNGVLITNNGQGVENAVQGCWEWYGYVYMTAQLVKEPVAPQNPALALTKTVDRAQAQIGDTLNYAVVVSNPGDATATNVVLVDQFPAELIFTGGTDFGSSMSIGDLQAGQSKNYQFTAKINQLAPGDYTIINRATATANGGLNAQAQAVTTVHVPEPPQPGKPGLAITKNVDKAQAQIGDNLNYTIVVSNPGDATATNVVLVDRFPGELTFLGGTDFGSGLAIGSLIAGQSKIYTIVAKINQLNPGDYTIINRVSATADGDLSAHAQAQTTVHVPQPPIITQAKLEMDKFVRNVTKGETEYIKENQAFAGDILEYKIWFKNIGDKTAENVSIFDVIAVNTGYVPNSAYLVKNGVKVAIANPVGQWVDIGSLEVGQSAYALIQVTTDTGLGIGTSLINTGYVKAKDVTTLEAQAKTTIKEKTVIVPEQPVVPRTPIIKGTELPKTGGNTLAFSALVFVLSGLGYIYRRQKAALYAAELGQF